MRKILLASTAIASTFAVASAQAEVSISGGAAMSYQSVSDDVTSRDSDQTLAITDNTVTISFSSVTDSGLAMSYSANSANSTSQNASISGDFGSIALSGTAHAAESFDVQTTSMVGGHGDLLFTIEGSDGNAFNLSGSELDIRANEANMAHLSGTNIAYYSPSINGFAFGVSIGGIDAADDVTSYGASYSADMGGASYSVGYASSEGAANVSSDHMGLSVSLGDITLGVASTDVERSTSSKEEATSYSVNYVMSDSITLNAGHTNSENTLAGNEMDVTSMGVSYTIASGLVAHLASNSFDLQKSGTTDNEGTVTSLVVSMSF